MSIGTSFNRTFQTLFSAPLLFLAVQIPQGILDASEYFVDKAWGERETLLMGLFALTAYVIGIVPSALTFLLTWKKEKSFKNAWNYLNGRWALLLGSAVVSGVLFAVGVMAYVIPGILLMVFYLFVPNLILTEPKAPLSSYFYRSSAIAKKNFATVLFAVVGALVFFVLFQRLGIVIGTQIMDDMNSEPLGKILLITVIMTCSMVVNALVNIWLSYFYLELKGRMSE